MNGYSYSKLCIGSEEKYHAVHLLVVRECEWNDESQTIAGRSQHNRETDCSVQHNKTELIQCTSTSVCDARPVTHARFPPLPLPFFRCRFAVCRCKIPLFCKNSVPLQPQNGKKDTQRQRQRQQCTETATANGNGETATEERQRNGGNRASAR